MVWQQLDFFRTLQVKNSPAPNPGPDNAASALVDHLQQQAEHGNLRGDTLPVEAVPAETVGTAETSGAATDAVREGEGEASPVSETNREAAGEIPNLEAPYTGPDPRNDQRNYDDLSGAERRAVALTRSFVISCTSKFVDEKKLERRHCIDPLLMMNSLATVINVQEDADGYCATLNLKPGNLGRVELILRGICAEADASPVSDIDPDTHSFAISGAGKSPLKVGDQVPFKAVDDPMTF